MTHFSVIRFFHDDGATSASEAAPGFVDYIRVDDEASTIPQPAVPEPASWGMMIAGLGAVGAAMRRRRASVHYA